MKNNNNRLRIWSIVMKCEQHRRYFLRKRSLWRESIRCSRAKTLQELLAYGHLLLKAVQKRPKNYWRTDTCYWKLCKNAPKIIGVRTPATESCAKTLQELLAYGHLLLKAVQKRPKNYWRTDTCYWMLCKNAPRIIGVRTPATESCAKTPQELLAYGHLLLKAVQKSSKNYRYQKLCAILQHLSVYWHLLPKFVQKRSKNYRCTFT